LRLALLAPDIVEAILVGRTDQVLMLEQLERPVPACWEEQRRRPFLMTTRNVDRVAPSGMPRGPVDAS